MVDKWLDEVNQRANPGDLEMVMVHNGIVRGTSKSGKPVQGMELSYDQKRLNSVIPIFKQRTGVVEERKLKVNHFYILLVGRVLGL